MTICAELRDGTIIGYAATEEHDKERVTKWLKNLPVTIAVWEETKAVFDNRRKVVL